MNYCYRKTCIPKTYEEAMANSDSHHWKKAMYVEINALVENDTYELPPLPEGRSVVGGRWIFAIKEGPNNEEKFKARYVEKGYSQVKDVDHQETFSTTARITSIRMLMQLSVPRKIYCSSNGCENCIFKCTHKCGTIH